MGFGGGQGWGGRSALPASRVAKGGAQEVVSVQGFLASWV